MGKVKIVSASAGSGKTYNLAYEYVRNVIREPELYRHILAVTFTNKATEEMKQRILSKIDALATGKEREFLADLRRDLPVSDEEIRRRAEVVRSNILHDYNRFSILTIDKFFQRVIRSFIKELGIEANFALELPVDTLLSKAADRVIDDISTDEALRQWITAFVSERIDEGKQWNIRGEIMSLGREIFTEAYKKGLSSARSKEALEGVIKKAAADAKKAEKDMVAAANAILNILTDNSLEISDISGGSRGVMSYIAKVAGGEIISCSEAKSVASTLETGKWYAASSRKKDVVAPLVPELHKQLERIYSCDHTITSAGILRENYRNFALLTDLQQKIADIAREENLLHISEINSLLSKLISDNDTPFIFEKTGNYLSHFMIDEFQDTSLMQWENFIPLLRNAVSQTTGTPVLLVGDVKQSIYRWRGGDWTILAGKAAGEFDETETRPLQDNYRSRKMIVEFNNAIVGRLTGDDNLSVNAELDRALASDRIPRELKEKFTDAIARAYSDFEQTPAEGSDGGYATVTWYERNDEGKFVAPVIELVEQAQRRGYAPRDIAILVREKREGRDIAAMLLRHKSANPDSPYSYDVITQDALVIDSAPISGFITACLRLSVDPGDDINRATYNRYLGKGFRDVLTDAERDFMARIRLKSPQEAFEDIVIRETAYLQAVHEEIISFMSSNISDIPLFLEWWQATGSLKSIAMPATVDAISIDTIHRSKGLGYKVVIIPCADWRMTTKTGSVMWSEPSERKPDIGSYPVRYRKEMANSMFAEEYYTEYVMAHIDNLNLFYVAVTRAKEELHIMIPKTKTPSAGKISSLITGAIDTSGTEACLAGLAGRISAEGIYTTAKFGTPASKQAAGGANGADRVKTLPFDSVDPGGRVAIKLSAGRYMDDGIADDRLTPRNYGVLMHKVFEQAAGLADVEKNIAAMRTGGSISEEEAAAIRLKIAAAFENPTVKDWFDGDWDAVRNENDIIVPAGETYRPDRVMIKGATAVVVDYKFGTTENPKYAAQLRNYMALLAQMGYTDVAGYIWYVMLDKIENGKSKMEN